jgi:hypothetical protein
MRYVPVPFSTPNSESVCLSRMATAAAKDVPTVRMAPLFPVAHCASVFYIEYNSKIT